MVLSGEEVKQLSELCRLKLFQGEILEIYLSRYLVKLSSLRYPTSPNFPATNTKTQKDRIKVCPQN